MKVTCSDITGLSCKHTGDAPNPVKMSKIMAKHFRSAHADWVEKRENTGGKSVSLEILVKRYLNKDLGNIRSTPDKS